jgi:hypothetical protein
MGILLFNEYLIELLHDGLESQQILEVSDTDACVSVRLACEIACRFKASFDNLLA